MVPLGQIERQLTKGYSSLSRLRMWIIIGTEPVADWKEPTLAIDPQERAIGFPFGKDAAAKEPLSGSIVLDTACDGVIC